MVKKIIVILSVLFILTGCSMSHLPEGELKKSCDSPDKKHKVCLYLCNGGATVDFAVRGEVIDNENEQKRNIYWEYPCQDVNVEWKDDETVVINGMELNIYNDEYDWRDE